ncbi:hypothetical protein F5B18DRAFT_621376 [Nemania serpens]|nr:hypothetical protein F5B18DRAFT_621376 [Nemania serpens]
MKIVLPYILALAPGTALALALAPAPSTAVAQSGGYYDHCTNSLIVYSTLISKCDGVWTSIDLNHGIADWNGQLIFDGTGYFLNCGINAKTNGQCTLTYDVLGCDCRTSAGTVVWSTLSLSSHLAYDSGYLLFN